jgi:hypothetical protein
LAGTSPGGLKLGLDFFPGVAGASLGVVQPTVELFAMPVREGHISRVGRDAVPDDLEKLEAIGDGKTEYLLE